MYDSHAFFVYILNLILLTSLRREWRHYYGKMDTKTTLKALFERRKDELAKKLTNLSLPKDAVLVQQIVTNYLNDLFDSEGDFRQNLTQSEDYILQAAMSLLNAQQSMVGEFAKVSVAKNAGSQEDSKAKTRYETLNTTDGLKKQEYPYVIGGSAVGGTAGAILIGSWGAVFGAIAGTAIALYFVSSQQDKNKKGDAPRTTQPERKAITQKIDVEAFTGIVGNICDSVDSLILTFRAQINRVVEKYENQEKPTFEKDYGVLLDAIQSLLGAVNMEKDEKWQKRIDSRIEDLAESLENYDLEVVKFDEDTKYFFDISVTDKSEQPIMVLPAIIKHGAVVRKGKFLVKD